MVLSKLEVGQIATGGELSGIVGIKMQSLVVHVRRGQQLLRVAVVLQIEMISDESWSLFLMDKSSNEPAMWCSPL